ncbi:uncharacterized protein LOC123547654 [Mercenaria mercenaria]|uniref:uncharacterized protein LOC123547654 n=1 Tax=Mercenaria mercenaria TaxID=6596 RepID=UPI00234E93F1|nr:uncharacterized protein LOC123547654 [Mercenaria mercenaria]
MDLSKAFDCLPHDLIVLKLKAYGLSNAAAELMHNYLTDRKQRVKLGKACSDWMTISKGVPQGSILGTLIFNIFVNDIFYFIKNATVYNYADDNTLSHCDSNVSTLKTVLENESVILINWFKNNLMQAYPDKFQAICVADVEPAFNRRYAIHLTQSTWSQGQTTCRESGGKLATIYDYSTVPDIFIEEEHLLSNEDIFWIGLHRIFADQSYVWDNGDNITWFNWKPGMTDNGSTLCVGASSSKPYAWHTMDCGRRLPFLCQRTKGDCRFVEFANMTIQSYNYIYLYHKNVEHCKNVCAVELGTRCRSFDYYPVDGRCEFNTGDRWTLDQYYRYRQGWVYFHYTCNLGEVIEVSVSPSPSLGCLETTNVYVTHDIYSSFVVTITHEVSATRDFPVTRDVIVTSTHVDRTTVTLTETSTHVILASPTFSFPSTSAAEDPIEELKEIGEVAVERKKTLKKISVDDRRPSAKYVGYVAIIFMSLVFGSIVLFDMLSLCRYRRRCCNVKENKSKSIKGKRNMNETFDWTKIRARKESDMESEEETPKIRQRNVGQLNDESITTNDEEGPTTSYKSDFDKKTDHRSKMIWRPFVLHMGDSGIDGSDLSSSPSNSDSCSDIFHFQYFLNEHDNKPKEIDPQCNTEGEESRFRYQITKF